MLLEILFFQPFLLLLISESFILPLVGVVCGGKLTLIPDVLILASGQKYRQQFETLWVAGMQERIKQSNPNTQKE